jgi:hypothetical protein
VSTEKRIRPEYDLTTAVTFLLGGIALGAIMTLLFFPIKPNSSILKSAALQPPAPLFPHERLGQVRSIKR